MNSTAEDRLDGLPIVENPDVFDCAAYSGLSGDQYQEALEQWAAEEVKTTQAQLRELGRFAVTMSTVIMALAGATLRAGTITKAPGLIVAALMMTALSFIPALIIAYPRMVNTAAPNLSVEFIRIRRGLSGMFISWCALWGLGIAATLAAVWLSGHGS